MKRRFPGRCSARNRLNFNHLRSIRYQQFSTRRKVFVFVGGIHVIERSVSRKYFDIKFSNVMDLDEIMATPLYVCAYYTYIHTYIAFHGYADTYIVADISRISRFSFVYGFAYRPVILTLLFANISLTRNTKIGKPERTCRGEMKTISGG